MSDYETAGDSSVWLPFEVRKSFLAIRRALHRRRYSQVDYLSKKYQKRFPAYAGYYLDTEGNAHWLRGHKDKAIELLQQANTLLHGQIPATVITLSQHLQEQGRLGEAASLLEQALREFPEDGKLRMEQCRVLFKQGHIHKALADLRELCAESATAEALDFLGGLCFELGLYDECKAAYARCQNTIPDGMLKQHSWLYDAHFIPGFTAQELAALCQGWSHAAWGELPDTEPALLERKREPGKRLRIGIVSPGLCGHPVGFMTAHAVSLLGKLPDIELYCYSFSADLDLQDRYTQLFRSAAKKWVNTHDWPAERVYKKILADKLDIAIDMGGHLLADMLSVFSQRVAPIQVKWVGGQFNTTGLPNMDYFLSDRFETPEGWDALYTEKLVRLPNGYSSYDLQDYGDTERLADTPDHPIVFGCFNTHRKLNPEIAAVWATILKRVPGSILFIKALKLDQPEILEAVRTLFLEQGIAPERLRLEGYSLHAELMHKYREVDIALDPWPFSGGLTTLEALWMGVPVVTTPGPSFAGRHSTSHLSNLGLESLIGETFEDYIEIAVKLANDRKLLQDLRILLPYSMTTSPMTDHAHMAADLHTAFRAMWSRYCEGLPPVAMRFDESSKLPKELEDLSRTNEA